MATGAGGRDGFAVSGNFFCDPGVVAGEIRGEVLEGGGGRDGTTPDGEMSFADGGGGGRCGAFPPLRSKPRKKRL